MRNEYLPQENSISRDCKVMKVGEVLKTRLEECLNPFIKACRKGGRK